MLCEVVTAPPQIVIVLVAQSIMGKSRTGLSDGTKVKRRVPRMRACKETDEKGKLCAEYGEQQAENFSFTYAGRRNCSETSAMKSRGTLTVRSPCNPKSEWIISQAFQLHQFPCLPLEMENLSMREPFQSRAQPAFRTARAIGDPSQLAAVPWLEN